MMPDGLPRRDMDGRDGKDFIILKIDAQGRVEIDGVNIEDPAPLAEFSRLEGSMNSVVS
jgi:hypothetical protein